MDPLRAGHVAVLESGFRYFCDASCKQEFLRANGRPLEEDVATAQPPAVQSGPRRSAASGPQLSNPPAIGRVAAGRPPTDDGVGAALPVERATLPSPAIAPAGSKRPGSHWLVSPARVTRSLSESASAGGYVDRLVPALDVFGVVCGLAVPTVGLLGTVAETARSPLAVAAWLALLLRVILSRRDASDPHLLVVIAPPFGALAALLWASATHNPRAPSIAALSGLACAASLAVEAIVSRAHQRLSAARAEIEHALDLRVRALRGEDTVDVPSIEVRPGEKFLVDAGETVGVDAMVIAGEARVVPWLGARVEVIKREGDPIVAGARVLTSRLKMMTTWSGRERAWVRLLATPASRVDVSSPTAHTLRLLVERGTPVAAALVGLGAFAANATPVEIVAAMSAGAVAFGAKSLVSVVGLHMARAQLEALSSGIIYKDAVAFERAASARVAVLSARGTVLLGEPEIVAIEPIGGGDAERMLALAAGAEGASTHPFAAAILRAARTRGITADHVRNATVHDGLGVTALASTGERLVVGGRGIMLEQKIGIAATDTRASELEAQGRSVLLVALGDRLLGLLAMQDGLRPGARAAVQKLLDAGMEPVLMSGEARDTCSTLGRALDIEHVRPEILPADRGPEVRALSDAGSVVAVIGHAAGDDAALGAADVSVAMNAAGSTPGEWAISLASDDIRDAAMALALPSSARERVRRAIALGAGPAVVALLAIGFGVAPLAVAPLASIAGALALAVQARDSEGRESVTA